MAVFLLQTNERRKHVEIGRTLYRLLNQSLPKRMTDDADARTETRSCHIRPVALTPLPNGAQAAAGTVFALTADMNGHGLSVYAKKAIEPGKVFVSLWFEGKAHVFLGVVRSVAAIGGGFCRIGLKLTDTANPDMAGMPSLLKIAARLKEPSPRPRRAKSKATPQKARRRPSS
jgi:hypothetical protein